MSKDNKKQKEQNEKPEPFFAKNQASKKLVIQTDIHAGRHYERNSKL